MEKINRIVKFTEDEKMVINLKKCKEMVIDFRKNKSVIPTLEVNGHMFEEVKSYKLLGMWIHDDLKWKTNVKYLFKNSLIIHEQDTKKIIAVKESLYVIKHT